MSFSRNWIGTVISQGERFVVQYLDRTFGGRLSQILEVTSDGVDVTGDLAVTGDVTAGGRGMISVQGSVEVDLTQAPGTTFTIVPAVPGKAFVPIRVHSILTRLSGFSSTSSIKIGVNGAHDNFNAAGAFPAATAAALGVGAESGLNAGNAGKLLVANTAVVGEITVAAVATTMKAVFYYDGFFVDA